MKEIKFIIINIFAILAMYMATEISEFILSVYTYKKIDNMIDHYN